MIIQDNAFLKHATLIAEGHPLHLKSCDAVVMDSRLIQIGDQLPEPPKTLPQFTGSAQNPLYISQGWKDGFSLITDPGREDKETFQQWVANARMGGFQYNTILPDTHPVPDNGDMVRGLLNRNTDNNPELQIIGALTHNNQGIRLAELRDMMQQGCKIFSHGFRPSVSASIMRTALEYLQGTGAIVCVIPFDEQLTANGQIHEGNISVHTGMKGIPDLAESIIVHRDAAFALKTGTHVHFTGISAAQSVQMIKNAKALGAPVSASVFASHLYYTDRDLTTFNTHLKSMPPCRSESDRYALIQGILEGTIDGIVSGHNPSTIEEKKVEFTAAAFGMSTLSITFDLAWKALVKANYMTPEKLITLFTKGVSELSGNKQTAIKTLDRVSVWQENK
jgi:dihydroorotase